LPRPTKARTTALISLPAATRAAPAATTTAPASAAPGGRPRQQRALLVGIGFLELHPVRGKIGIGLAGLRTQDEEIVGRPETWMPEQAQRALAGAVLEPRLQLPDLAHRRRETARQGDVRLLARADLVGRDAHRFDGTHALLLQHRGAPPHGFPQPHREQEELRYRPV